MNSDYVTRGEVAEWMRELAETMAQEGASTVAACIRRRIPDLEAHAAQPETEKDETDEILSDPVTMDRLRRAEADYAAGVYYTDEEVRGPRSIPAEIIGPQNTSGDLGQPETSPSPCRCGAKAFVAGRSIWCVNAECPGVYGCAGDDPARVLAAWNELVKE